LKIKKVLVSQPKPASEKSPYYDIAEKYGVKIDFRPFIKVESLSAKEFRQQKISVLDHTAVIFTSRHAIDHFFHLCTELRVTIPETMKYFCVTEAVAQICIEEEGKEPSPAHLRDLIEICKEEEVRIIFVQPEFDRRNAEIIAKQTNTNIVDVNPLSYNWEKEMIHIANSLCK
jgi:uroporphyrinogen-III synthase